MCQIIYSPDGELMPREAFDFARYQNADGIGIMSAQGPEKFIGRKAGKRAWRYLRRLSSDRIPYGVHFRWATHGAVTLTNCHPFATAQGDALVMHNGVLSHTAKLATDKHSDTFLFVEKFLPVIPDANEPGYFTFVDKLEKMIGWVNKFLICHARTGDFTIVNENEGAWIDGFWYSNEWSVPANMLDEPRGNGADDYAGDAVYGSDAWRLHDNSGRRWADLDRAYPLPVAGDEYADRNVSDALNRASATDRYYRAVAHERGYFDDGAELGTRAAANAQRGRDLYRDAIERSADRARIRAIDTGRDADADYREYERATTRA